MSLQQQVWDFLRNKGLAEKSVSAIMGNIYQESGFDVNLVEYRNGIGFGLCQWSFSRRSQLEKYGITLTHQLEFLWSELTGQNTAVTGADYQWIEKTPDYLSHADFMNANGTIDQLTASFCFSWERPNFALAGLSTRQTKANEYYTQFTGSTPAEENSPVPSGGYSQAYVRRIQTYLNAMQIGDANGNQLIVNGIMDTKTAQAIERAKYFFINMMA